MDEIGEIRGIQGEITIEWKIKDFFSSYKVTDKFYYGPKFYFSGASWAIKIYPNGQTIYNSLEWIDLYLMMKSSGTILKMNYSLAIKNLDGKKEHEVNDSDVFYKKDYGWGRHKFVLRSLLEERKSTLVPSDVLTVICTLKVTDQNFIAGSLFNRLQAVSDNLRDIYEKSKRSDIILKVNGKDIQVHRIILETRSPFFEAMFKEHIKENKSVEISVEDVNKNTLNSLLKYIYSGDLEQLTTENVLPIYAAAEKFAINDVKEMCSKFITKNLSVEWVCDVIKFAELHQEEEMCLYSRKYFEENADKVLKTDKWKIFVRENHELGVELLSTVVTSMMKK